MVVVLLHHHADRHVHLSAAASRADRWKQDLLLLGEVLSQLDIELFEVRGQPMRAAGLLRVDPLHSPRRVEQRREIGAERLVVAGEDEVDDVGQRPGVPPLGLANDALGQDLRGDRVGIETSRSTGIAELLPATAAEVESVAQEDQGGCRVGSRNLTKNLIYIKIGRAHV